MQDDFFVMSIQKDIKASHQIAIWNNAYTKRSTQYKMLDIQCPNFIYVVTEKSAMFEKNLLVDRPKSKWL